MSNRPESESLAEAELGFFENELTTIKTLSELAETRYKMGFREDADHAKQEALKGVLTVRRFLEKPRCLAPETVSEIASRCDELELLVDGVGRPK